MTSPSFEEMHRLYNAFTLVMWLEIICLAWLQFAKLQHLRVSPDASAGLEKSLISLT